MSTSISTTVSPVSVMDKDVVLNSQYPVGVPLLIIDDDVDVRTMISRCLEQFHIRVVEAENLAQARELMKKKSQKFSFVFLDKCLPDGDGVEFYQELRSERPDLPVVIITANGSGAEARSELERGVFDYLAKPFPISEIRELVTKRYPGLSTGSKDGVVSLGPLVDGTDGVVDDASQVELIAHSPSMISVTRDVSRIAKMASTPVIIFGETGVGKGVVARLIHQWSSRAEQKFVSVNCGAVPQELIEAELFGHVKGAFTGAHADRRGHFEEAEAGTIFLDEITETTPAFQVKLLRVLEEGHITRVGSSQEIKLNVRVIAATNRNVREDIDSSGLRKDLYYRLSGSEIFLPRLKERPEDIMPLAVYFALKVARKLNRRLWFSEGLVDALKAYTWPGNVRQLSQVIKEAVNTAVVGRASEIMLASDLRDSIRIAIGDLQSDEKAVVGLTQGFKTLDAVEEEHVLRALRVVDGNMSAAARLLGRSPRWFSEKCRAKGWLKSIEST
jgi:DNA-binding NtrC family response regulator